MFCSVLLFTFFVKYDETLIHCISESMYNKKGKPIRTCRSDAHDIVPEKSPYGIYRDSFSQFIRQRQGLLWAIMLLCLVIGR